MYVKKGEGCSVLPYMDVPRDRLYLRVRDCCECFARAYCTMNEKFSILHEAKLSAVLKISSSSYSKQVRVFENKTRTNSL